MKRLGKQREGKQATKRLNTVLRLVTNSLLTTAAQQNLVMIPKVSQFLSANGVNIQAITGSRGYGKRKRSAKSSFAGNFRGGRKKGRR